MPIKKAAMQSNFENIARHCGWNGSELDTHWFLAVLTEACKRVNKAAKKSLKDGLAMDCVYAIAQRVDEIGLVMTFNDETGEYSCPKQ